jgi:ankyrin repeat protein
MPISKSMTLSEFKNEYRDKMDNSDACGWKPIHLAVQNDNKDIFDFLFKKYYKSKTDDEFHSVLSLAVQYNRGEMVKAISNYDSAYFSKEVTRDLLFQALGPNDRLLVVTTLLSYVDKDFLDNTKDDFGTPILVSAAAKFDACRVIGCFLNRSVNINIQDSNSWTALMVASRKCDEEVVKLLLYTGANVNIKNNNGFTALMLASQEGHEAVVKLLLKARADVNIQDSNECTALMLASSYGHEKVVSLLLGKGADVNIQNNDGFTALMVAYQNGHEAVIRLLSDQGADVNNGSPDFIPEPPVDNEEVVESLSNVDKKDGFARLVITLGLYYAAFFIAKDYSLYFSSLIIAKSLSFTFIVTIPIGIVSLFCLLSIINYTSNEFPRLDPSLEPVGQQGITPEGRIGGVNFGPQRSENDLSNVDKLSC